MMEKTLLLIDDSNEQMSVLETIGNHLRSNEGINLLNYYINPNDRNYLNDRYDPDLGKLVEGINAAVINRPNLIVIDLYYGDSPFNGLNVVEKLRSKKKFRHCPVFLISGKREKILEEIFENAQLTKEKKIKKLEQFIEFRIERILDKTFKDEAIQALKKQSVEEILPSKMRQFPESKIHQFSPKYRQMTMADLADRIEAKDPQAPIILGEMFELTIAHYAKIDEKLQ